MNSKLRDILAEAALDYSLSSRTDSKEVVITEAEKAIRQAVGEEMLELINNELSGFEAGGEIEAVMNTAKSRLRQKIKQWQGGEDE